MKSRVTRNTRQERAVLAFCDGSVKRCAIVSFNAGVYNKCAVRTRYVGRVICNNYFSYMGTLPRYSVAFTVSPKLSKNPIRKVELNRGITSDLAKLDGRCVIVKGKNR